MPTSNYWLWGGAIPAGYTGHEAGRALLGRMYRAFTGEEMPEIGIGIYGKPCFLTGNLHFSISHTRHFVFCALGNAPLGVDAEERDRHIDLRLAEKILTEADYQFFQAAAVKNAALLRLWVQKEAAVKWSGTGLRGYPKNTPTLPPVRACLNCWVAVKIDAETADPLRKGSPYTGEPAPRR